MIDGFETKDVTEAFLQQLSVSLLLTLKNN